MSQLSKVYASAPGGDAPPRLQSIVDRVASAAKVAPTTDDIPGDASALKAKTAAAPSPQWSLWRAMRSFERSFQQQYQRLSWTTRQTISTCLTLVATLYILVSVPLRVGFFFDPYHATEKTPWTPALTAFTALDALADTVGALQFQLVYHMWRDIFSLLAESVKFELGKKISKKARLAEKPKVSTRNRQVTSVEHDRHATWTLATLSSKSHVSSDKKAHLQRRMNTVFFLELVALLPVEIIVLATQNFNLLHVIRLTKLCRAYRIWECVEKLARIYSERRFVQRISLVGISSLVGTIVMLVMYCHIIACGYMLVGHAECGLNFEYCDPLIESSWVVKDRLIGATAARKYGRALYWSSRTMVMLGYDDVTPTSSLETVYVLAAEIVGVLHSTSVLATFLFIFRVRKARQVAFNAHVDSAREYMKLLHFPGELRRKVTSYFTYVWNTHHSLDGEEVLHNMPKHLKSKVVYTLKAGRIRQVSFLMKESVEFINLLALALLRRAYIPHDSIIEPKINAKMFFVIRGTVILSAFDGSSPKECQTGDFFAECCLLFPDKYEEKAVAKSFCELYVLEKAKFDEAIGHFFRGREKETMQRIIDTFDKHLTQMRKTRKLLGLRGGEEDARRGSGGGIFVAASGGHGSNGAVHWRLPGSTFRIRWDLFRLLAIIYVAFEVPYYLVFISNHDIEVSFRVSSQRGARYIVTLLLEIFFFLDLIFRSRLFAYLDPTVMLNVTDPTMIFSVYRSNGFYLDFMAVLPIALALESLRGLAEDYAWGFRLLRLVRLRYIEDLLQDITDHYGISSKFQRIMSLVLGVTLMLHIVACLWFKMAWIDVPNRVEYEVSDSISRQDCLEMATLHHNCTWVLFDCYGNVGAQFPINDPDSLYKSSFAYIRSMYWSVVALTGVGYGDIAAFSTSESYYAAIWIFVGGIINFGVVGAMSSTISTLVASQHHYVEKLNTVNFIMEHLKISEKLRSEIRRFYRLHYLNRKKTYESQLLRHLPDQLCYEISSLLHSHSSKCIALFETASREFLEEVTGKLRTRIYQNGETCALEGDMCREFLVISQGRINMFCVIGDVPVGALIDGDCYGVSEFLLKKPHASTLIAASIVSTSVMTRENFDIVVRKYADEMVDILDEAHEWWVNDISRLKRISKNLTRTKFKAHVRATPSLFYQKEMSHFAGGATAMLLYQQVNTVDTQTKVKNVWNIIITLWNILNAFFIIFRITFHEHLHFSNNLYQGIVAMDLVCDAFFAMDIYLRLYFIDCDDVTADNLLTRAVRNNEYRTSFAFKRDLVACLPLYYFSHDDVFASAMCRLPRLLRCLDLWEYIDEVIIEVQQIFASKDVSSYLSPAKMLFFLLLGSHYAACIFFWISDFECEQRPDRCWISSDHVIHEYHHSIASLYVRSFYWALTTLALVGTKEIVSRDILGTMWATITCLGCTFIIGYIIGEISELILDVDKEEKEYKDRVHSFERFAMENDLPESLIERATLYLRTQFKQTHGRDLHVATHDLSANLRLKLMQEIYGAKIASLPICRFLTEAQVNNLSLRLKSEVFIPGDDILVELTYGSRLCVMKAGIAAVFWSESTSSVAMLLEGCLFGELAFFLPTQRRIATVKATTSCEVLYISKHEWSELWTSAGDLADNHVRQYALHSILEWVRDRVSGYERTTLSIAKRINKHIMGRKIMSNLQDMMAPTAAPKRFLGSIGHGRTFVTSEEALIEQKAKYLLSRAEKYAQMHAELVAEMSARSGMSTRTSRHHSAGRDITRSKKKKGKILDTSIRQFFAPINPVSKQIVDLLSDEQLKRLEDESWRRYGLLAAMDHVIDDMMHALIPMHHEGQIVAPVKKSQAMQSIIKAVAPDDKEHVNQRHTIVARPRLSAAGSFAVKIQKLVTNPAVLPRKPSNRRLSALDGVSSKALLSNNMDDPKKAARLPRKRQRSHSLPIFCQEYFADVRRQDELTVRHRIADGAAVGCRQITYDVLQRYGQHKYRTLYTLYRRYIKWRGNDNSDVVEHRHSSFADIESKSGRHSVVANGPDRGPPVSAILTGTGAAPAQSPPRQQTAHSAAFQALIKRCGRAWDILTLVNVLYFSIVIPLKAAFAEDLSHLTRVKAWFVLEYLLDAIAIIGIVHRFRKAQRLDRSRSRRSRLTQAVRFALSGAYEGFLLDLMGAFPLEAFVALVHDSTATFADAWPQLCAFRLNKLVYATRLRELFERVFQVIVNEWKLPVDEARLAFFRSLFMYLLCGHWIACAWYAVGDLTLKAHYHSLWISYPGALVVVEETGETTHDLDHIPMGRKYIRSMHFAIGSITTTFYGDVVSMNIPELITEMIVVLFSIYVFGSLVGAHSELHDVYSRNKAEFEQNLTALQHYLQQNAVPKALKKQIKQYYASVWRRRHGEDEFAAIETVSPSLREDVVYSRLSQFARKVTALRSLDVHFLRRLLVCLQYVICSENEEVVIRGDVDRSMYFIHKGRVLVKRDASELTKEEGECFGELALLYGVPREETCIALSVSELYRLDYEPYEALLLEYPEYRKRNKLTWTNTIGGKNHTLSSLAKTVLVTRQVGGGGAEQLNIDISEFSRLLDDQVPRSYVFKAAMEVLANLDHVDSLEAKHLVQKARRGARLYLKRLMGIETARDNTPEAALDADCDVHSFTTNPPTPGRGGSTHDGEQGIMDHRLSRIQQLKREWHLES
ncbi:hypothetical protein PINS_up009820 [Pythium insidiosum]|nr:hypothetical protein PINS_up009820 [Pythium insidiosum]